MSDDGGVVVDGLAVHGLPHAFPVEGELLHRLLLGEVRPLVEDLPRGLMLETRHVEEPLRRANVRRHGDPAIPAGWTPGGQFLPETSTRFTTTKVTNKTI